MILFYPLLAAIWLMAAIFLFYAPPQGILSSPLAPYGALLLAGYNLVRFALLVRASWPRRVHHDSPLPDRPVIAPEFDFDDRDKKDAP